MKISEKKHLMIKTTPFDSEDKGRKKAERLVSTGDWVCLNWGAYSILLKRVVNSDYTCEV
jgi:hypothetical protein